MIFENYLIALRTPFLVVSLISAAVAGALAFHNGEFNPLIFIAATVAVVVAHAGTNLTNDYFDYKAGNYPKEKKGPTGGSFAIQNKLFTENQILTLAIICYVISLGIFVYLSMITSPTILLLGLIGVAIGFFYTAPPLKLGYTHLGEFATFIGMGPLLFSTVYIAMAGNITIQGLLISIFIGLQISNILIAAEIPDINEDKASKKITVASLWGDKAAINLYLFSAIIGAAALIVGIWPFHLPIISVLGLLGSLLSLRAYQKMNEGKFVEALGTSITALELGGVLLIFALIL